MVGARCDGVSRSARPPRMPKKQPKQINYLTNFCSRSEFSIKLDGQNALVAQLDRVSVSEAEGHRFDSCRAHHKLTLYLRRKSHDP